MNYIYYIIVSAAIVTVLTVIYLRKRKKSKQKTILPDNCNIALPFEDIIIKEGEISMSDVVEWFKSLTMDKNQHIPFIANQTFLKTICPSLIIEKEKQAVFLGVLNEMTTEVEFNRVIIGSSFSVDLKATLGDQELVVLS